MTRRLDRTDRDERIHTLSMGALAHLDLALCGMLNGLLLTVNLSDGPDPG
jgi:hypothetical protein